MLDQEIFKLRRSKLLASLKQGDAVLIGGYPEAIRNNDNHYLYRQESSLYYLTGIKEENTVLLIRPGKKPEYSLFVRPKDALAELWDGYRTGPEGAVKDFLADEAYEITALPRMLSHLLKDCSQLYYQFHINSKRDKEVLAALEDVRASKGRTGQGLINISDPTEILGELRCIKSEDERELMRRSGKIAAEAHKEAMRFCKPGVNERHIQAVLSYMFLKESANDYAYHPIVGSGNSATVLHYRDNDRVCKDGDILLVDAGCEFEYYASDITRSYPVNGKFSKAQRLIYDAVLKAQNESIALVRPGVKFVDLQNKAIESLSSSMHDLDLFEESVDEIIGNKLYRKYYPHNIGHWLGLDVHDRGRYFSGENSRGLEEGMVLTIEPGIYIPANDTNAAPEFRGIGIRIEDDILVSNSSFENLTKGVPTNPEEIEAIMAEESFLK